MRWAGRIERGCAVGVLVVAVLGCRDKCKDQPACAEVGECKSKGSSCIVGSDEDCRSSKGCSLAGECAAVEQEEGFHLCRASQDADCRVSEVCKRFGHCAARQGGCSAFDPKECQASLVCAKHGSCDVVAGSCVPGEAKHCSESEDCKQFGLCSLHPAAADYDACKARVTPKGDSLPFIRTLRRPGARDAIVFHNRELGNGHQTDPCRAYCHAGSDDDCARSEGCKKEGRCKAGPEDPQTGERECVAGSAPPAASSVGGASP